MDTSPYDDKLALVFQILETLGANLELSSMGTSIGTSRFGPEMKTLTFGRAQFLCDPNNGVPIDIYAHIFQILGRTIGRSATRTCLHSAV